VARTGIAEALRPQIDDQRRSVGEIIDALIKVMEGGKEAFKERERRYGSHLSQPTQHLRHLPLLSLLSLWRSSWSVT